MITKHQYLHTLGKLCVNHCISSTSWGYPRSNYVCLNLHGTGCKNSEPSTIFSCTDFNHRSMSTSPDKSSSLLSGIRNSVGAQCNVVRWRLYDKTIAQFFLPAVSWVASSSYNSHLHFQRWVQCHKSHICQHSSPLLWWLQKQSTYRTASAQYTWTLVWAVALHLSLGNWFAALSAHSFLEVLPTSHVSRRTGHPVPQKLVGNIEYSCMNAMQV